MPVYNEESTLEKIIDLVEISLDRLKKEQNIDSELIIVDDGSKDESPGIIFSKKLDYPNIISIRKENGGKGSAIRKGWEVASGDVLIIQDSDLEYDPLDYKDLLVPFQKDGADVVYGSRRLHTGQGSQWSHFTFYLGGRLVTWATNIIYQVWISDEPTCYKCFSSKIFKKYSFEGNKFEFEPELTAKVIRLGYEIHEVPIHYYPRKIEEGKKIKWTDGVDAIKELLRWRFKKIR